MTRREKRRTNREAEKAAVTRQMTDAQLVALAQQSVEMGRLAGIKAGIRVAVETCMNAYALVLAENEGFDQVRLNRVFKACNEEVFRALKEKELDLADIPAFARNVGVEA